MRVTKVLGVVLMMVVLFSCNTNTVTNKSLETELDSVSYAIGMDMALKLKVNFSESNKDLFLQGYNNGLDSTNMLINEKDINMIISTYFRNKQQKAAQEKAELTYADVKKAGEDFIAENKTKEGVVTTTSGLQYIVITEGSGYKPLEDSKVSVHYHGTLVDGTVFDSSVDKGTPSEFYLNQVIKGWTEGLQLMNVGSKYKFFVPQELAYGANPRSGGVIKPFMPLVFEIELLEIIKD